MGKGLQVIQWGLQPRSCQVYRFRLILSESQNPLYLRRARGRDELSMIPLTNLTARRNRRRRITIRPIRPSRRNRSRRTSSQRPRRRNRLTSKIGRAHV